MRLITISELVHVEEVGNLLQTRLGKELWTEWVRDALQGDESTREDLGQLIETELKDLVRTETLTWEAIWRERKRWFHAPNPCKTCDCPMPLHIAPQAHPPCPRCPTCPRWQITKLKGFGWYRASINVWPFRMIRGITIDAQVETQTEPGPLVVLSLAHMKPNSLALSGWTYTSQPGSQASCGIFVNSIVGKYGRQRTDTNISTDKTKKIPQQQVARFEYSQDDDKQVWTCGTNGIPGRVAA
jgi:hypothetical protein